MKRVLLVEDSKMAQALMRKYLQGICELSIRSDIPGAFEILKDETFDLLIVDFMFPDGDSFGLIENVRSSRTAQELPIIVVSASVDRMLMTRLLRAGVNDALLKPLVAVEFRALVERMFSTHYIREAEDTTQWVNCFQWRLGGAHHQYCPELGLTVSSPTKLGASQSMKALLEQHAAKGVILGAVSQEGVVTHVVETDSQGQQADPPPAPVI